MLDAFTNEEAKEDASQLTEIFMVMQCVDYDLSSLIGHSENELCEQQGLILIYNLLLSLNYLHTANVIHRDIKPSNILITQQCTVKICDLGFARTV